MSEQLIKSKNRVKAHGEVFTPSWMVQRMLNTPSINDACNSISATFLEPAAGDGNFLSAILERKLEMVSEKHCETLSQYENYSLYALSTIYGVELLFDNVKECVMRLIEIYMNNYRKIVSIFSGKVNPNIEESARIIIKNNIQQGNFLTQLDHDGSPIEFIEWKAINNSFPRTKTIKVSCQPFTLLSMFESNNSQTSDIFHASGVDFEGEELKTDNELKYLTTSITLLNKRIEELYNGEY